MANLIFIHFGLYLYIFAGILSFVLLCAWAYHIGSIDDVALTLLAISSPFVAPIWPIVCVPMLLYFIFSYKKQKRKEEKTHE